MNACVVIKEELDNEKMCEEIMIERNICTEIMIAVILHEEKLTEEIMIDDKMSVGNMIEGFSFEEQRREMNEVLLSEEIRVDVKTSVMNDLIVGDPILYEMNMIKKNGCELHCSVKVNIETIIHPVEDIDKVDVVDLKVCIVDEIDSKVQLSAFDSVEDIVLNVGLVESVWKNDKVDEIDWEIDISSDIDWNIGNVDDVDGNIGKVDDVEWKIDRADGVEVVSGYIGDLGWVIDKVDLIIDKFDVGGIVDEIEEEIDKLVGIEERTGVVDDIQQEIDKLEVFEEEIGISEDIEREYDKIIVGDLVHSNIADHVWNIVKLCKVDLIIVKCDGTGGCINNIEVINWCLGYNASSAELLDNMDFMEWKLGNIDGEMIGEDVVKCFEKESNQDGRPWEGFWRGDVGSDMLR